MKRGRKSARSLRGDPRPAIARAIAQIERALAAFPAVLAQIEADAEGLRFSRHGALSEADALLRQRYEQVTLAREGLVGARESLKEHVLALDEILGRRPWAR